MLMIGLVAAQNYVRVGPSAATIPQGEISGQQT